MRPKYLAALLEQESLTNGGVCGICQGTNGMWRCQDCIGSLPMCRDCCRSAHRRLPMHRVQYWQGKYYETDWLCNLGVAINLMHAGSCCPTLEDMFDSHPAAPLKARSHKGVTLLRDIVDVYRSPSGMCDMPRKAKMVKICHTTGVHKMWVRFCECQAVSDDLQLLTMGLFPGSFTRVELACTVDMLNQFRIQNLESKSSIYHYFKELRRKTCPLFPSAVDVSPVG